MYVHRYSDTPPGEYSGLGTCLVFGDESPRLETRRGASGNLARRLWERRPLYDLLAISEFTM